MSRREGIYEPLGVSGLGSTGLRILYRMVEALSVCRVDLLFQPLSSSANGWIVIS